MKRKLVRLNGSEVLATYIALRIWMKMNDRSTEQTVRNKVNGFRNDMLKEAIDAGVLRKTGDDKYVSAGGMILATVLPGSVPALRKAINDVETNNWSRDNAWRTAMTSINHVLTRFEQEKTADNS